MKNALPQSASLMLENVVTATILTNLQALLHYGSTFRKEMFQSKKNWSFIAKALDLQSANRLSAEAMVKAVQEEGEVQEPKAAYERLLLALQQGIEFDEIYPVWLDGARKRYVGLRAQDVKLDGVTTYEEFAAHHQGVFREAALLGGMAMGIHGKAV